MRIKHNCLTPSHSRFAQFFIVRCMVYEVAMIQNAPKNMLLKL